MKIRCKKCGDILTGKLNKFISCSCNAIYMDVCHVHEDGREVIRIGGNPEDIEYVKED